MKRPKVPTTALGPCQPSWRSCPRVWRIHPPGHVLPPASLLLSLETNVVIGTASGNKSSSWHLAGLCGVGWGAWVGSRPWTPNLPACSSLPFSGSAFAECLVWETPLTFHTYLSASRSLGQPTRPHSPTRLWRSWSGPQGPLVGARPLSLPGGRGLLKSSAESKARLCFRALPLTTLKFLLHYILHVWVVINIC